MKENKRYSLFSNINFMQKRILRENKINILAILILPPITVLASFLSIYLSSEVVLLIENNSAGNELIKIIGYISFTIIAVKIIQLVLTVFIEGFMLVVDIQLGNEIIKEFIYKDYELAESKKGLDMFIKALSNTGSDASATRDIGKNITNILTNIIGVISYTAILYNFNINIVFIISVTTFISYFILKKTANWLYENKDNWQTADRKIKYIFKVMGDFSYAKDLRIYGLFEWLQDMFNISFTERLNWVKKEKLYNFKNEFLVAIISLIRDVVSYGILVYVLIQNNLKASDFIFYFGIIGGFSTFLSNIMNEFNKLYGYSLNINEIREYFDYKIINTVKSEDVPNETFSIEFKNVYYKHKGSDEYTIKNLSFKIEKGEKLAIVGINGAGKTTIVKLICRLYTPTSGEILINGININKFDLKEYLSLFSVVFQDIVLLPCSIKENIVSDLENINDENLSSTIKLSGFQEKIYSLKNGINTNLIKTVNSDGIELSGGEIQKLALARALYKAGKALILDEPTAALDPIAESQIYNDYNKMSKNHTSVFISHRLASTRFCDRILMIEGGEIIEEGSHDFLINKNGKYAYMYEVQSHYYKNNQSEKAEIFERNDY